MPRTPDERRPRARHIERFPHKPVALALDTEALLSLRTLLRHSRHFRRPYCGNRAGHWTTPAIMDVSHQLAHLDRIEGRDAARPPSFCDGG